MLLGHFVASLIFGFVAFMQLSLGEADTSGILFQNYQDYEEHLTNIMKKNLEKTNMHLCMNLGETFSGSFLVTKERLLNKNIAYNLSSTHVEQAVTMMASRKKIMQTLDVLDMSIINLSTYERLIYRIYEDISDADMVIETQDVMEKSSYILKTLALEARSMARNKQIMMKSSNPLDETVVIIPALLSRMGSSNSKLALRKLYFEMCFWSLYQFYSNIVVFVTTADDYNYLKFESHLPISKIIVLGDIPTPASLPVASVQYTKERLLKREWTFKYVFYTEADQVLIMRKTTELYGMLKAYPKYVISPHRVSAYPDKIITGWYRRKPDTKEPVSGWQKHSCCLPRQDCSDRSDWVIFRNTTGLPVSMHMAAAGSSGFAPPPLNKIKRKMVDNRDGKRNLRGGSSDGNSGNSGAAQAQTLLSETNLNFVFDDTPQVLPELMNIYGLQVGLGNSNFHKDLYRACKLSEIKQQCSGQ